MSNWPPSGVTCPCCARFNLQPLPDGRLPFHYSGPGVGIPCFGPDVPPTPKEIAAVKEIES